MIQSLNNRGSGMAAIPKKDKKETTKIIQRYRFVVNCKQVTKLVRTSFQMECYTTPWPLWRESRNLWHFIELSFAFGVPLSLFLPYCSLFFVFTRVIARLQARGTRAAITLNSFIFWF